MNTMHAMADHGNKAGRQRSYQKREDAIGNQHAASRQRVVLCGYGASGLTSGAGFPTVVLAAQFAAIFFEASKAGNGKARRPLTHVSVGW
jgi:hypothetical protein